MTPNEERLVVELQSKWGNRWSRIARKLPGRTDNEIKNYWRTHMRKKAQERKKKKKALSSSSSSSSSSSFSNSSSSSDPNSPRPAESSPTKGKGAGAKGERSFYDTGGVELPAVGEKKMTADLEVEEGNKAYSMDDLWKEFEFSEENCALTAQTVASPIWDYCPTDSLWCMSEEENKMLMMQQQQQPVGDHHFQSFPFCNYMFG